MKIFKYISALVLSILLLACEDEINTLGSSLDESKIIVIVDSTFVKVTGESIFNDSILGRTTDPLLGNLTTPNYGTLQTGYLTQFMPTLNIDTAYVTLNTLDSLKLYLNYYDSDLTGDSLAPMILDIYRLNKTLNGPLYTNIDPSEYFSPNDLLASKTIGSNDIGYIDESNDKERPYKRIEVDLPLELGKEVFNKFKSDPEIFSTPTLFADFFPGIYMNISYGNGRVINIKGVYISMFYRAIKSAEDIDTLQYTYMGVTPEIFSINHFTLKPDETLIQGVNEGKVFAQTPIGYTPIIHFPTQNIIDKYKEKMDGVSKIQNILNSLSFTIPIVEHENSTLNPPSHLLFIRKSQVKDFFERKELPDNVNSVYATYNSEKKLYDFGNISKFIADIMAKGEVTEDDETIALVPVQVVTQNNTTYYETSTVVTNVSPYSSSPTIVELDLTKAQIKLNYTHQTTN